MVGVFRLMLFYSLLGPIPTIETLCHALHICKHMAISGICIYYSLEGFARFLIRGIPFYKFLFSVENLFHFRFHFPKWFQLNRGGRRRRRFSGAALSVEILFE